MKFLALTFVVLFFSLGLLASPQSTNKDSAISHASHLCTSTSEDVSSLEFFLDQDFNNSTDVTGSIAFHAPFFNTSLSYLIKDVTGVRQSDGSYVFSVQIEGQKGSFTYSSKTKTVVAVSDEGPVTLNCDK